MAELYGKRYTRKELLKRIGNMSQIGGIREYVYDAERARGVKAVGIDTGPLRFETLPSRCLDVSYASYKGVPFAYIAKSGLRHPAFFSKVDPGGFADNFCAGVLTTCGLENIGGPSVSNGKKHELHGEIANMPAGLVAVSQEWEGDDLVYSVSGEIRHSRFYGEDTVLKRKISAKLGASSFTIEDEVENQDFAPALCLLLYHANFGFPFVDVSTRLITSPRVKSEARPGVPPERAAKFAVFEEPKDGEQEVCIYHTFKPDADGFAAACLFNPDLGERGMGAYVRWDTATLPCFVQWKMMRSREYVCGLEPGSAWLENRDQSVLDANTLQPLQKRRFRLEIGVIEGEDECRRFVGAED